ncbi:hypothetical protein BDN70DRAFT_885917 [Pholiota conissans]|uniref:Uncharacterized protein n=1 Tax=Pholiota conissans TaxID=109636 RepID=A0A9P6CND0_9AGAR|nr:hypothetical protein BDN70DRAFT_885917 [Pholiota conissans]
MGSAQSSYITPEAAITALAVVGAVALGYTQIPTSAKDATPGGAQAPAAGAASQKKGKNAKVKGKAKLNAHEAESAAPSPDASVLGPATPASVAASVSLPGQFDEEKESAPTSGGGATKKNKKKGKKAATSVAETNTNTPGGATPSLDQSVSASIDYLNASEIDLLAHKIPVKADGEGKKKKKKGKGKAATPSATSPSTSTTLPPVQAPTPKASEPVPKATKMPKTQPAATSTLVGPTVSSTSLDTDGSWTRVGAPRRTKGGAVAASASAEVSAAEQTTPSGTGTSSPVVSRSTAEEEDGDEEDEDEEEEAKPEEEREFLLSAAARAGGENRKTLAERLVPKPRKTHVEDMLTTPDYPTLARVVRVKPRPDEKPADGFTWGDYEDVRTGDDADGEGGAGEDDDEGWGVVTSRKSKRLPSGTAATPAHKATKASETLTKKQRQNQQRNEDAKAARAAVEAERLAVLAKHKRELEAEKLKEQFGAGKGGKKSKESGGMVASVDASGRLVWE